MPRTLVLCILGFLVPSMTMAEDTPGLRLAECLNAVNGYQQTQAGPDYSTGQYRFTDETVVWIIEDGVFGHYHSALGGSYQVIAGFSEGFIAWMAELNTIGKTPLFYDTGGDLTNDNSIYNWGWIPRPIVDRLRDCGALYMGDTPRRVPWVPNDDNEFPAFQAEDIPLPELLPK